MALVTGGARRVGRAVALRLAGAGYDVALTYRQSESEARQVVEQIEQQGRRALAIRVDLAEPDADAQVHSALTARFDRLDALINNAAIFSPRRFGEIDVAEYDRFQAVNARAPLMLMQRFAPMLARHFDERDPASTGRVVNFIDIHVLGEPFAGYAAYNASKAALLELTSTAAVELGPSITVNAIAPGVVAWASDLDAEYRQRYLARTPLGRAGTPEDAAEAVRWLVCDAHYCTGQIIRVDGGRWLR
ncbi:MAG: SDR family oxidoreductase [Phycisphaeraceae bacterium]